MLTALALISGMVGAQTVEDQPRADGRDGKSASEQSAIAESAGGTQDVDGKDEKQESPMEFRPSEEVMADTILSLPSDI